MAKIDRLCPFHIGPIVIVQKRGKKREEEKSFASWYGKFSTSARGVSERIFMGFMKRWQLVIMVDIIIRKMYQTKHRRISEVLRMKNVAIPIGLFQFISYASLRHHEKGKIIHEEFFISRHQQNCIGKLLEILWGLWLRELWSDSELN